MRPAISKRYEAECLQIGCESNPSWIRQAVLWRVKSGRAPDFDRAGLVVHRFHYEDLINQPEAFIPPILVVCELDDFGRTTSIQDVYTGPGPGGTDRARSNDANSVQGWRNTLGPVQQADILTWAEPLAGRLGYG
jgi:hypothetical protein